MPDWLNAILAVLVTILMMRVIFVGADKSPENSSPLEWVFNGLKWYLVLAFTALRDRRSDCKVTHMIAASEMQYYGSIRSDEERMHVQSCPKHQNIFKQQDAFKVKPTVSRRPVPDLPDPTRKPRPPKGKGAGSRKSCVVQLQVGGMILYGDRNVPTGDPGPGYNPPRMSVGEADSKRMEREVHRLHEELDVTKQELEKLMKIVALDEGEKRSRHNTCKHEHYTVSWDLDGSGLAICDSCWTTKRLIRGGYQGDAGPN